MSQIAEREWAAIHRANESAGRAVVFVHGLWLLASSWDEWCTRFEEHGWTPLAPGWPDDPYTVAEAREHPMRFAGKSIGQVTSHYADVIRQLTRKPIVIGHSFGGLITQKLAGMGLAAAAVAIDPAPFRGVLPLPLSALRAAFPVLGNPLNAGRAVTLTPAQFRFAFANAVSEEEADSLYTKHHVAGPGKPLFQAAFANLNPWTDASVNTHAVDRGPLLIISGQRDNTVPWAIANASFRRYRGSKSPTEIEEIPNRGHSLTIDSGWQAVADTALRFLERHRPRLT
jgi:pimeloyl-ACP methyl ester carboxylesterase